MIKTFKRSKIIRVSPDQLPRAIARIGTFTDAHEWRLKIVTPEGGEKVFRYKR